MTAFVLDASVTAAWLLPDELTEHAKRAYARLRAALVEPHAPELWLWECGNIIANAVRRARLTPEDALLTWSILDAVRTRVELATFEPSQVRACLTLALDHGLSIYDAAYLWLASTHADAPTSEPSRPNIYKTSMTCTNHGSKISHFALCWLSLPMTLITWHTPATCG